MSIRIPTWNPLRVHRESWPARQLSRARLRRQHVRFSEDKAERGRRFATLPRFKTPEPYDAAPGPKTPVKTSHADAELRWNALGLIHGARQAAIEKLKRIDIRLTRALGRCTLAQEKESKANEAFEEKKASRAVFLTGVPDDRRDELERHSSRLARLVPVALIALDTTIMIGPWHLFGAPSLPFLPYHDQTAVAALFAILRALLVSLALIATAKLAGSAVRMRIGDHHAARRAGDVVLFLSVLVTTILLVISTAKMQAAYIAIASGGFANHLPTSVFLMVTLFVIVASVANGYWTTTPLAERNARLVAAVDQSWKKREQAAKELDARETAVRAIAQERAHLLASLRELENEQLAYEQRDEATGHLSNWPLHGLEDLSPAAVGELRVGWSFDEMPGLKHHAEPALERVFPRRPRLVEPLAHEDDGGLPVDDQTPVDATLSHEAAGDVPVDDVESTDAIDVDGGNITEPVDAIDADGGEIAEPDDLTLPPTLALSSVPPAPPSANGTRADEDVE